MGKNATSDSVQSDSLSAAQAFDGDSATRWSSGCNTNCDSEPHWLAVDLASRLSVCGVSILWEAARAADYQIQCSDDGTSWTSLASVTGNQLSSPTAAVHYLPSGSACSQLRVYMTLRGTSYGYSAYTVQVWGPSESSASIYGDPHLQGAHRDRADFRGAHRGIYNLLSWSHVTPPLKVTGHPRVTSRNTAQADHLPPFSLPSDTFLSSPCYPRVLPPYRPCALLAAGSLQPARCRRPGSKHLLQRAGSVMAWVEGALPYGRAVVGTGHSLVSSVGRHVLEGVDDACAESACVVGSWTTRTSSRRIRRCWCTAAGCDISAAPSDRIAR